MPWLRLCLASLVLSCLLPCARAQVPVAPTAQHETIASEMESFLATHVLGPRFPTCVDEKNGGFHTTYARDWSPRPDGGRFIVYQSRVVWTAATLARLRPETAAENLPYVRHGVRYLADVAWDKRNGGFHNYVTVEGAPSHLGSMRGRPVYGQAFALYAMAAAHAATGDAESLELAKKQYRWIEAHYRDDLGPGYRTVVESDGRPFPPGGTVGMTDTQRTMNDHIHLLEAYAELLRVWPDDDLRQRTEDLLAFVRDRLFVEPGCLYFALWPDGRSVPAPVSFGHDVETAFLMLEAEEALGRTPTPPTIRAARMLVDHALAVGWSPETGQLYEEGRAYGPPVDRSIEWWGQFEWFNALSLMDELFGDQTPRYRDAFEKAWGLTRDVLADHEYPGVCSRIEESGETSCELKSHDWFSSYHTARALLFTADRLRKNH